MSLNIKNERVHELVREAARRTGRSQTSVVEAALEAYLRDLDALRDAGSSACGWYWRTSTGCSTPTGRR